MEPVGSEEVCFHDDRRFVGLYDGIAVMKFFLGKTVCGVVFIAQRSS